MTRFRLIAIALLVSAVTAFTACSATVDPSATPTPETPTLVNLDSITVKGERLASPTLEMETPFKVSETMTKVLVPGSGQALEETSAAELFYYGVNARTGERFDDNFGNEDNPDAQAMILPLSSVIQGFKKGLTGQSVGSRVLIAMPGSDGYDYSGGNSGAGIQYGDSLVFVVDIVGASLPAPVGTAVTPAAGLPTVTDTDGKVEIAIPDTAAPTEVVAQVLIQGNGEVVEQLDFVFTHYVAYSWKTKEEVIRVDDRLDIGRLMDSLAGLITGLEGKKVGSRVMVIIPPAQGFPYGSTTYPIDAGDTLVFVVDLLMVEKYIVPEATPDPTESPVPSGSPSPTPEASVTSTPSDSPTPTPSASPTPTPEASPTPTSGG